MTTQIGPAPRRPSRLIDLIRSYGGPGNSRLGFAARITAPQRKLAVVATLERADPLLVERAVQAGADAVEIVVATERELLEIASAVRNLSVPAGVLAAYGAAGLVANLAPDQGFDWVRLPIDAPLSVLSREKPARILSVPVTLDLRVASAVTSLPVDAVVLEASDSVSAELTLGDVLRLRAVRDVIQKPVLVNSALGLPPAALTAVDALGVNGLMVPVGSATVEMIRAYIASLEAAASKPQE
jgi:hypothetical protein